MTRVAVSGALANRPGNGGGADIRLTWLEALRRAGFEVWFVEQIDRANAIPSTASDASSPVAGSSESTESQGLRFFREVTVAAGIEGRAFLVDDDGAPLIGPPRREIEDLAADTELLVNLGGHLRVPSIFHRIRRRAYVDLDPGFTQIWHADRTLPLLDEHQAHFTVGLNLGSAVCPIPVEGIRWRPLPPPVLLDEWSPADDEGAPDLATFTTVAAWRGTFAPLEHRGRRYGIKAHEMRKLLPLPERVEAKVEIALDIHPADASDLEALRAHGWRVVDPRLRVATPRTYRSYLRDSHAELSAAQGIYVDTRSGWISDRTARYLAAGRPALVQDTGIGERFDVGEGLVTFEDLEGAIAGARRLRDDYPRHRRRSRQLAEEHFDSRRVVARMLEDVEVSP